MNPSNKSSPIDRRTSRRQEEDNPPRDESPPPKSIPDAMKSLLLLQIFLNIQKFIFSSFINFIFANMVDSICGGAFMEKTPDKIYSFYENLKMMQQMSQMMQQTMNQMMQQTINQMMLHQKQIIEALRNKREEGQVPSRPIENPRNYPTIGFQQGEFSSINLGKNPRNENVRTVNVLRTDFVVLEIDFNRHFSDTPIILGRPFLHTVKMNINFPIGIAKISCGDQSVEIKIFKVSNDLKKSQVYDCHTIDLLDDFDDPDVIDDCWDENRKHYFFSNIRNYFWHDLDLYYLGNDQILRRCCGFYWPTIIRDFIEFSRTCISCQSIGNMSKKDEMPMSNMLVVKIFDVWRIDFMGPFSSAEKYEYILLAVDYVLKWVEAIPTRTNDHKIVMKFVQENIFSRFGCPRVIISDGGTHFTNKNFKKLLKKNGVLHRVATSYHPQTNGQAEVVNRKIQRILRKKLD
ncbi:unnamed protein product [Spirodela intermedia]|uniref:Integrase catalytic domain-containing protein n=2 Tax=Spirodela intermedia TaxID=51605 RepID=A0A7I8KE83_SPIIN|nr:unnamed protein product [Spirodela intermedia]